MPGLDSDQHSINESIRALRSKHCVQQIRRTRSIKSGVGLCAAAALPNGIAVFQKLRFLRIFKRNKNHGITAGRNHASGQANHGVRVATNDQLIAQLKTGSDIHHRFVMTASNLSTVNQIRRPSWRSEEHTSELQSRPHLVCRLLLEKKKKRIIRKLIEQHRL